MLLNSFFFINSVRATRDEIKASLHLEKLHPIFGGHFPGKPVVPGVCMLQMIKEVIEKQEGKNYFLQEASSLKFLSVLDPEACSEVESTILIERRNEDSIQINGAIFAGSVTFFKMKATLKRV